MPSGKQSRKARRTPPPPTVQRRRQASPRVLIGGAVVVAAVAVAIVLAVVLGGGGGSSTPNVPARGSLQNALPGAADVHKLLAGIPQRGNVLGKASAPVTLVEYVDLQCPYCRAFETQAMPTILSRYVRPGKLKVELRPIAILGSDSERGREAAIAAGEQNHLFDFAQILYDNQGTEDTGWLNDAMVQNAAASIPGLDVPKLVADRGSTTVSDQAKEFDALADADGVNSTPTLLIGKTGATLHRVTLASPTDLHTVEAAIMAAGG